jgi:low temperature requirement protein LtrA
MLTEHEVALDANFSQFGYSAHLRTKDVDSSSSSIVEGQGSSQLYRDWSNAKDSEQRLKFWKRPVVRQYFHKGLLWRSKESGKVASFELFIDLLYVGIIGVIGDTASEDATASSLLHFIIIYILSWRMWADISTLINWFETGDIVQRLSILFYITCLLGFTVNIANAFESTYTAMIAFYLAERLFQGFYFFWVALLVPTVKGVMVGQGTLIFITCPLWIASVHVEYPNQLGLVFLALMLDVFSGAAFSYFIRATQRIDLNDTSKRTVRVRLWALVSSHFDFYPAVNIEHRVERNSAFVGLVFGYSVFTILYQNRISSATTNSIFGKACLLLIQTFAFNWIYFEIDLANMHIHAIRRHFVSGWAWLFVHIPFVMGYTLAAATMSKIVLSHDCPNADADSLTDLYQVKSLAEISTGLRWFYCGGLSTTLISSCLTSLCHKHKTIPYSHLTKHTRLSVRFAAAIIILMLPLAHPEDFSSLSLVASTCGVTIAALMTDLYGLARKDDQFWFGGFSHSEKKATQYAANFMLNKKGRQEIKKSMKLGHRITIKDLMQPSRRSSFDIDGVTGVDDHHSPHIHTAV